MSTVETMISNKELGKFEYHEELAPRELVFEINNEKLHKRVNKNLINLFKEET